MWRIDLVKTDADFAALEAAWGDLVARVPEAAFMQSFAWCQLTRQYSPYRQIEQLRCVVAWQGQTLVAVWPCVLRKRMGVRCVSQLGLGIGDYSRPLIDPQVDAHEIGRALLHALVSEVDTLDVVCLDFEPGMTAAISEWRRLRRLVHFEDYSINPHTRGSWHAFWAGLSKNMRNHLTSSRRKLGELGKVTFSIARSESEQAQAVEWTLTQKQAWLERRHIDHPWYLSPDSRTFLRQAARLRDPSGYLAIFTLQLDETILASWLGAINKDRIGALMITFDTAYQRFSPGMLLIEDVVHYAYNCGLVADLGGEEAEFKERWATDQKTRVAYCFGLTPAGLMFQTFMWARETFGPRLKAWLPSALVARLRLGFKSRMATMDVAPVAATGEVRDEEYSH